MLVERDLDVLVAFISSQIQKIRGQSDVFVSQQHPEFARTGLKKDSVICLDKLATLSKSIIIGEIGEVGAKLRKIVNKTIRKTIKI